VRSFHDMLQRLPASFGGVVMATGMVSLALSFGQRRPLVRVLLVITALEWLGLGFVVVSVFARRPIRLRAEKQCRVRGVQTRWR
jgi:tellurite resistance protein TehA-like permease